MEKKVIGIIVAIMSVIGATLLLVGCVGKGKVNSPSDVVITNTYQVKDISKNKMIREEGRQRLIKVMRENNFIPDGDVKFSRVIAYNSLGNRHYIAMEFKTRVVGYSATASGLVYLSLDEVAGQYSVINGLYNLSGNPETDESYKGTYEKALNRVEFCEGAIPSDNKKM